MRYIPLYNHKPAKEWIEKADLLIADLGAAPDAAARAKIIDKNSAFWGELKEWLLNLSHGKCWFSEAKDCFSHWEVEHFRPKKSAIGLSGKREGGYWWLAFDWRNFRICGNVGNRKKGVYFPLREGCHRVTTPGADLRYEDPLLLDPADGDDPALLSFDLEGKAIAAAGVRDEWERTRVEYSIKRYNLDFPALESGRKTTWQECWTRIEKFRAELELYQHDPSNHIAKAGFKGAMESLRQLIRADQQFSAVARACILSTGDKRLQGILQSN